jgi:hypothetical protein
MENAFTRDLLDRALTNIAGETGLKAKIVKWEPRLAPPAKIRPDALIEINGQHQKYRFAVEAKNIDRFEMLHQIRAFWPKGQTPQLLLVAPYITPKIAERCREIEMYFADTAGNMYLRGPGLHVYVVGKPKPPELHVTDAGRAINPAGLKVVFALLCQPELLNATYREIAARARVALGTVGPVMKDLEKRKHITPDLAAGPAMRRFLQADRLLQEWVAVYPTVLRPKLNIKRFRAQQHKWIAGVDLRPYNATWGGEVAANKLVGYLEPQTATIYAPQLPRQLIVDQKLRADINGDVEILDLFWNFQATTPAQDVVPPILAYADLMATTDGRNLEAAKMIYERYICTAFANQT